MDRSKWYNLTRTLKRIVATKRMKFALYIAMVLWVAVAAQVLVNRLFQGDIRITEAFVKTNAEEMQSSIEIAGEYNANLFSAQDKKNLICDLAAKIGLVIDKDISVWEEGTRSEYYFYKLAKNASSEIKLISVEEEDEEKIHHYIIIRLSISDGIQSIDKYKNILEETFERLEVKDTQITLKYEGNKEGNLTPEQKHAVALLLVDDLQGEIALEYDEGDLYTVYAYTGMLKEYITSMGNKINIQIAISYNELTNKTKIELATPVLSDNW